MNSLRCARPDSFASGIALIRHRMESTIARLNSNPPSSRRMPLRKFISVRCFAGNLRHKVWIASTTTILNSSGMSDMKAVICFMSRSTEDSAPVLSSVVIASVATERLESEMSASMSMLQFVTESGWIIATLFSARIAANRSVGLDDDRNSCSTVIAGCNSRGVTQFRSVITRAASKITISLLCRKHDSRKS